MTAALFLAATAAALLTMFIMLAAARRSRRRRAPEPRVVRAVHELGTRMDELSRQLGDALDRVEGATRVADALAELGATADLDGVLERTAHAAAALPGADASVVRVEGPDGMPLVASVGVLAGHADEELIPQSPDGLARPVSLTYFYDDAVAAQGQIRSAAAVALVVGGRHGGFVAAYSRSPAGFDARTLSDLQALADHAAPAIEAASSRERSSAPRVDTLTGLPGRRGFHDALAYEVQRARHAERPLALVVLDVDDFREVNRRIGPLAGDSVLVDVAARVRECIGPDRVGCRVGGDEFAVILPDATLADAESVFARVQAMLERRPPERVDRLALSAGITQLLPGDDAVALFERAEQALQQAKQTGKRTAVVAAASGSS